MIETEKFTINPVKRNGYKPLQTLTLLLLLWQKSKDRPVGLWQMDFTGVEIQPTIANNGIRARLTEMKKRVKWTIHKFKHSQHKKQLSQINNSRINP